VNFESGFAKLDLIVMDLKLRQLVERLLDALLNPWIQIEIAHLKVLHESLYFYLATSCYRVWVRAQAFDECSWIFFFDQFCQEGFRRVFVSNSVRIIKEKSGDYGW